MMFSKVVIFLGLLAICSSRYVSEERAQTTSCSARAFKIVDQQQLSVEESHTPWHWNMFTSRFLSNTTVRATMPVITAEVSTVPCKAHGCCNMLLSFRPGTADEKVFDQIYLQHMFASVMSRLKDANVEYILDAGANVGYSAVLFALMFPQAKIVSIEADLENYRMALINTARFPNIHVVHAGLWSKPTHLGLLEDRGEWSHIYKEVPEGGPNTVPTTTVTHIMRHFGFPRLDFAKIDIEGAEVEVFGPEADLGWLDSTKLLVAELHDAYNFAHYYNRTQSDTIVISAIEAHSFAKHVDGEHTIYDKQLPCRSTQRRWMASTAGGFDDAVTAINKEMDALFGMANSATVSDAAHQIPLQTTGTDQHTSTHSPPPDSSLDPPTLSHIDAAGRASMVDVSEKQVTTRTATASALVHLGTRAFKLVAANQVAKGDVLTVAQLAGIMGAKHTSLLIPLCHPLALSRVDVQLALAPEDDSVRILATAKTDGKTGVEMEALTAASVAALTVYDMCKAASKDIVITDVRLEAKTGGKSADYRR